MTIFCQPGEAMQPGKLLRVRFRPTPDEIMADEEERRRFIHSVHTFRRYSLTVDEIATIHHVPRRLVEYALICDCQLVSMFATTFPKEPPSNKDSE